MIRFRSVEADRPDVALELDGATTLRLVGDEDHGPIEFELTDPQERAAIAEGLRNMKTYARGGRGESPTKFERELLHDVGFIGIHSTEHAVSIHLGRVRGELVTTYVHISAYDAGILAKHLEGSR